MASFTDNVQQLTRFNPYVSEQPVDAMVGVGMQREEQFQQGIQKVQSYYDNLLSLPISKRETQEYVKQKVGQLNNSVRQNLQGDFSDSRLTNQIGGLASKIASDPIVQNGIISTAAIQSGFSKMQEAQKAGKSASQNEGFFQEQVSKWQNDGDLTSQFNGSYTPYVDAIKKATDLYKETHPGENIPDDAFRKDENGKVVINPTVLKGVDPSKLQSIWNLVAGQPDVQNQMNIDGWAKYHGASPEMMYNSFREGTNASLKANEDAVKTLQTKLATDGTVDAAAVSDKIEQLKQINEASKTRFGQLTEGLKNNPDGVKAQLVSESMGNSFINAFSYQTMEKSPLWETSNEERKFQLDFDKYKEEQRWHDLQYNKDLLDIQMKGLKSTKDKKDTGEDGTPYLITDATVPSQAADKGQQSAIADRDSAGKVYIQTQRELANKLSGDKKPYIRDANGTWMPNIGRGTNQFPSEFDVNEAAQTVLAPARDGYINGKVTDPTMLDAMDQSQAAYTNWQAKNKGITEAEAAIAPQIQSIKDKLPAVNIPYGNNSINQTDFADVYVIKNKLVGADAARARLEGKFGKNGASDIMEESGTTYTSGGQNYSPYPIARSGNYNGAYSNIASKLSGDKGFASTLQQVNDEYKKRQSSLVGKVVTYDISKESMMYDNANKFATILNRVKDLSPGSSSGDINDMLAALNTSDKNFKGNHYESGFDPYTGQAYLRVDRGDGKPIVVNVPTAQYFQVFQDQKYTNDFRNKFGARLDMNQNQYTGTTRADAYSARMPASSKYIVQYNVEKNGEGDFSLKCFVSTKNAADTPIINNEYLTNFFPGAPTHMTEADVMQWTQKLSDPTTIDQIMQYRQLNQQNNK